MEIIATSEALDDKWKDALIPSIGLTNSKIEDSLTAPRNWDFTVAPPIVTLSLYAGPLALSPVAYDTPQEVFKLGAQTDQFTLSFSKFDTHS